MWQEKFRPQARVNDVIRYIYCIYCIEYWILYTVCDILYLVYIRYTIRYLLLYIGKYTVNEYTVRYLMVNIGKYTVYRINVLICYFLSIANQRVSQWRQLLGSLNGTFLGPPIMDVQGKSSFDNNSTLQFTKWSKYIHKNIQKIYLLKIPLDVINFYLQKAF